MAPFDTGDAEGRVAELGEIARRGVEQAGEAGAAAIDKAADAAEDAKAGAREGFERLKDVARDRFDDLRGGARAGAGAIGEKAGAIAERASHLAGDAGTAMRRAGRQAYVGAHAGVERQPIAAVLGAAAVGYLIGYLVHARRR